MQEEKEAMQCKGCTDGSTMRCRKDDVHESNASGVEEGKDMRMVHDK
jgi:hypothetical protein